MLITSVACSLVCLRSDLVAFVGQKLMMPYKVHLCGRLFKNSQNFCCRSITTGLPRLYLTILEFSLLLCAFAKVQVSMLPARASYPVCGRLRCRLKSTRAQRQTTLTQMARCPSQICHNRAYKKSLLDQSHSQLRHPSFPLVIRRACCLSPMATAKRSSCMVRMKHLYAATYP